MQANKENKPTLRRTGRKTKTPTCECDTYCWKKKKEAPQRKKKVRRQDQPLEFADANQKLKFFSNLRQYRQILPNGKVDEDSESSDEEPETYDPKYSPTNLPLMTFFGSKKKLTTVSQKELRRIIPKLCRIINRRRIYWGRQDLKPKWWPKHIPFQNIRRDMRSWTAKEKTTWTEALRQIVRSCYRYYGQEYKVNGLKSDSNNNGNAIVPQSIDLSVLPVINGVPLISTTSRSANNLELQNCIAHESFLLPNYNQEVPLNMLLEVDENAHFAQEQGHSRLQHAEVSDSEVQNTNVSVDMNAADIFTLVNEFSLDLNPKNSAESTDCFILNDIALSSAIRYDIPSCQQSSTLIENSGHTASSDDFLELENLEQPLPALFFEDYSEISPVADDNVDVIIL